MRAVEDHHVDRPDVEARQRVKLTGTNPSIGLILPGIRHRTPTPKTNTKKTNTKTQDKNKTRTKQNPKPKTPKHPTKDTDTKTRLSFNDLVVMARVPTPDPIPNSAVKPLSADGTASQGVGE